MAFECPALPYAYDALEPIISKETLEFHHDKHHQAYVTNLNNMLGDSGHESDSLEGIILKSDGPIFNNAAQIWNHSFYWQCLVPQGQSGTPSQDLASAITEEFGSYDDFVKQFSDCAAKTFGSGWAWLVLDDNELKIVSTSNAQTPLTQNQIPLLTCDVWEHAYYIDYRNARPKYIESFWSIVNWTFVSDNFAVAKASLKANL